MTNENCGIVWILETKKKDFVDPTSDGGPWAIDRTRIFKPTQITARIIAQDGWFTAHRLLPDGKGFIALDKNTSYKKRRRKVRVPDSVFSAIRKALGRLGIHDASQFPDLDGVCRHVQWTYTELGP